MRVEENTIQKKKKKRSISSLIEENDNSEPIHIQLQCNKHLTNEKEVVAAAAASDSSNTVITYACTLFQKSDAQNRREYFALVHEENQYRIQVVNNDALDDYSVSVLVNGSPLGREELIVIPKDTLELDAFYGQMEFDANVTTIVIYTSRVDAGKKSRIDEKQDGHYKSDQYGMEWVVECLLPHEFIQRTNGEKKLLDQLNEYEKSILLSSRGHNPRRRGRANASKVQPSKKKAKASADAKQLKRIEEHLIKPLNESLMATERHLFHSTYYPQENDEVAFLRDGYLAFWKSMKEEALLKKHIHPLLTNLPPMENGNNLPDVLFCLVKKVDYKCVYICNETVPLTLRTIELYVTACAGLEEIKTPHSLVGTSFKLDYFDHPLAMANYMILRSLYECSIQYMKTKLKKNMVVQSSFDHKFHSGKVVDILPKDPSKPNSPWEYVLVQWKDNSISRISAWEIKAIEKEKDLKIPALDSSLVKELYAAVDSFSEESAVQALPTYGPADTYPLLLDTIKERLKKGFYRSIHFFKAEIDHYIRSVKRMSIDSNSSKLLDRLSSDIDSVISKYDKKEEWDEEEDDEEDYSSDEDTNFNERNFSFSRFTADNVQEEEAVDSSNSRHKNAIISTYPCHKGLPCATQDNADCTPPRQQQTGQGKSLPSERNKVQCPTLSKQQI